MERQKNNDELMYEQHTEKMTGDYVVKKNKRKDFIARILCVLAAFLIWLYVMSVDSPEYEETFQSCGIFIENATVLKNEYNMSVISGIGSITDVTLKGKKSEISKYSSEDIKAYVDLSEVKSAGRHELDVKVDVPSGLILVDVNPSTVQVYVDEDTSKTVKVVAKLSSYTLDASYELGALEPDVAEITVRGPEQALESIEYALADLNLGTLSETVNTRVDLTLIDKNGDVINNPYLKMLTDNVKVKVPVYSLKNVPLTVDYKYGYYNNTNANVVITPASVTLKGDPKELSKLDKIVLTTIDEKSITKDFNQHINIPLPEGIMLAENLDGASLSVTHKNTVVKTLEVTDIPLINPNGLSVEVLTKSLNIDFRVPATLVNMIDDEHIKVSVDLTYISDTSGTFNLPLKIDVDQSMADKVYEIGDYRAQLTIK